MIAAGAAVLRLVDTGVGEPAWNMAVDAALLTCATRPTLRLYGWIPAGLSLGHFQDAAGFAEVTGDHEIVRRSTGGGAIYHGDELTFALALASRDAGSVTAIYGLVHGALVGALRDIGVAAHVVGPDGPPGPGPRALRRAWCFEQAARFDVVAPDGRKLAGSAQRRVTRPTDRTLLHGSLVLHRPAAMPFCAAVADQVEIEPIRAPLRHAFAERIARALDMSLEVGTLDAAELAHAAHQRRHFAITDLGASSR